MSSRIFVKNLPKHISDARFRSHFAVKGEVTDSRLIYTSDGTFRRFGFIGYRSEEEAKSAQEYFNNSFIDTSRIVVEVAKAFGDASLPRAWSVYTKGTTLYNQVHGIDNSNPEGQQVENNNTTAAERSSTNSQKAIRTLYEELVANNQDDPRFKEFLQVMAPRAQNKTWGNDDYANWHTEELAAVKDAVTAKREQIEKKDQANPSKGEAVDNDETKDESITRDADTTNLSDMEWLRMHMSSKTEADDVIGEEKEDPADNVGEAISKIRDTGRLFIRNLPYLATEDDLREAFEKFGPLSEVHIPISKDTKRPKGFAYILYLLPEHAVNAYKAMDNKVLLGRLLHVLPGKEKPQARDSEDRMAGFKSDVKKERDAKRKAQAGNDFNWNSLYMSADAVADSISERLRISKADLLSAGSSGNPAVRLALAETHIISDTKKYFEDQGIVLENFSSCERSDTVILVKNIPYSVDEDELRGLFGKHGSLGRVLLPPSRTIAIVEFLEPSEARAAFKHLAYKRLKDAPLYLERAPKDLFSAEYDPEVEAHRREKAKEEEGTQTQLDGLDKPLNDPVTSVSVSTASQGQGSSNIGAAGCVLFVKNLDFDTTEDTLRQVFSGVDGLASVTVRRKRDPKRQGKWLSMGFGFVEYRAPEAAQQALESFQGIEVDDHSLEIKMSDRLAKSESSAEAMSASSNVDGSKKPKGTKLVIKNIPFEATRKDIRELTSAFGQIKAVRLPKNFSGGHRGFAFIEFLTPQEAQHVLDTMKDTHLYGRHLVIDWAEEENSLQAIREKVGRQFAKDSGTSHSSGSSKRRKIELDLEGKHVSADESDVMSD